MTGLVDTPPLIPSRCTAMSRQPAPLVAATARIAMAVGMFAGSSSAFAQASEPFPGRLHPVRTTLSTRAADLDADGDVDLAAPDVGGTLKVLLNLGGGVM